MANTGKDINRLDGKLMWKLTNFVKEEFVKANCTDVEFAKLAEKEMQCPITFSNIAKAREILDIPSHKSLSGAQKKETRIDQLERRVTDIERRLDVYFSTGVKK